jgi:beta-phosphoglucomutase
MGARFEACIFDLDGVLVDTARFHFIAWREMAEGLGIPFHEKDNELLKGLSRIDSLETILSLGQLVLDPVTKLQLMEQKNARYMDLVQGMTAEDVLPGVTAFFAELDAAGIRKGVGSASKNAPEILRRIGLLESLDVVVDGSQVTLSKPDPEVFLKGAQRLGVAPVNCVVFEDALAGIQAAHSGGFPVVGVGSEEVLHGADLVIPGFQDLHWTYILNNL